MNVALLQGQKKPKEETNTTVIMFFFSQNFFKRWGRNGWYLGASGTKTEEASSISLSLSSTSSRLKWDGDVDEFDEFSGV